eukprot:TRINITY_DN73755_c0_g1_i1.p1 TRINITY_DN73755_c0_g1~~TRINITY_DN73755_c0_g1_i1.p1  ORF type:complete len:826 (+),score=125.15 TRINITY_DN73755_c0_g1_i1:159-2636(+)
MDVSGDDVMPQQGAPETTAVVPSSPTPTLGEDAVDDSELSPVPVVVSATGAGLVSASAPLVQMVLPVAVAGAPDLWDPTAPVRQDDDVETEVLGSDDEIEDDDHDMEDEAGEAGSDGWGVGPNLLGVHFDDEESAACRSVSITAKLCWEVDDAPVGPEALTRFGPNGPPMNIMDGCAETRKLFVANQRRLVGLSVDALKSFSERRIPNINQSAQAAAMLSAPVNRVRCGYIGRRPVVVAVDSRGSVVVVPTTDPRMSIAASMTNYAAEPVGQPSSGRIPRPTSTWGVALSRFPTRRPSSEDEDIGYVVASANDHCVKRWILRAPPDALHGTGEGSVALAGQTARRSAGLLSNDVLPTSRKWSVLSSNFRDAGRTSRSASSALQSVAALPAAEVAVSSSAAGAASVGGDGVTSFTEPAAPGVSATTAAADAVVQTASPSAAAAAGETQAAAEASDLADTAQALLMHRGNVPSIDLASGLVLSAGLDGHVCVVPVVREVAGAQTASTACSRSEAPPVAVEEALSAGTELVQPEEDTLMGNNGEHPPPLDLSGEGAPRQALEFHVPSDFHQMWNACWVPLRSICCVMPKCNRDGRAVVAAAEGQLKGQPMEWAVGPSAVLSSEIVSSYVLPFLSAADLMSAVQLLNPAHAVGAQSELQGIGRTESFALCFSQGMVWLLDPKLRVRCQARLPFQATFAHACYVPHLSSAIVAAKFETRFGRQYVWAVTILRRRRSLCFRLLVRPSEINNPFASQWPMGIFVGLTALPVSEGSADSHDAGTETESRAMLEERPKLASDVFTLLASRRLSCHRVSLELSSDANQDWCLAGG